MANQKQRDNNRRQLCKKQELKRIEYKSIIQDLSLPYGIRFKSLQMLNSLNRNGSPTRLKNRCIATGRGRGVYRFCKLSRVTFREMASQGLLMGATKSSWWKVSPFFKRGRSICICLNGWGAVETLNPVFTLLLQQTRTIYSAPWLRNRVKHIALYCACTSLLKWVPFILIYKYNFPGVAST